MVTSPVRRVVVREMVALGLSERRAMTVGRMSASALHAAVATIRTAQVAKRRMCERRGGIRLNVT